MESSAQMQGGFNDSPSHFKFRPEDDDYLFMCFLSPHYYSTPQREQGETREREKTEKERERERERIREIRQRIVKRRGKILIYNLSPKGMPRI